MARRHTQRPEERRFYSTAFEARTVAGGFVIAGHAAVFDRDSQDLGGFVERIAPGAFRKTVQEADVRALFNHDPNLILGRTVSGTLRISEDRTGLPYEIQLGKQTYARDLYESIDRGDVSESSFGFYAMGDDWSRRDDGTPLRTLTQVSLHNGDVSPVVYAAYLDTAVAARSAVHHLSRQTGIPADELVTAIRSGRLPSDPPTPRLSAARAGLLERL